MTLFLFLLVLSAILYFYRNKGIPAVLYHQINDYSNVNGKLFEEHIKYLVENGYKGITVSEYINNEFDKKDKNIMITFDDGYYDNYAIAFPILKKYNIKSTIFLNSFYIKNEERDNMNNVIKNSGEANKVAMDNYNKTCNATTWQYMTWVEAVEMHKSGIVDFQAHSHKHTPIFVNKNLLGIIKNTTGDSSDLYLYGRETKEGDPVFRKRGECSTKGIIIKKEFFEKFNEFYKENKEKKNLNKLAQSFTEKYLGSLIKEESESDAEDRIYKEGIKNKIEIENFIGKKVEVFCWPWGHRSKFGMRILEKAGYRAFVTTKKGTNSIWGNNKKIRRIELRDFTLKKFILNIKLNRNLIIGRLYELVS